MPSPPPTELVARAAELRAGGASWEKVAAEIDHPPEDVRRWPERYRAAWDDATRAARARAAADAAHEAVHILRQLTRSEDEAMRRDAARLLLGLRDAGPAPAADAGDAGRVAAYLGGLSDAEVEALVEQFRAGPA